MNFFGIELVLCDSYLTRLDLTKGVLFDTFFIAVFDKFIVITDYSYLQIFCLQSPWALQVGQG